MSRTFGIPEAIVSTQWLADKIGHNPSHSGLRIFECTTYLDAPADGIDAPYTVRSGQADFDAGHIPDAGFLDLQAELSDNSSPSHLRFTMPAAGTLANVLKLRGIDDDTRVVLYSRGNIQWATRVWWMLRAIGFDNAAILDGGWDKWAAENRATSNTPCSYAPGKTLTVAARPSLFANRAEVEQAMASGAACTINALSAELHRGDIDRYGRPGRIPGSVNVPALSLLKPEDKTFRSPEETASLLEAVGANPDGENIVYCGGGIAATLDAFLMVQLGYQHVSVYDASMSEWARDSNLPMEIG